MGNAHIDPVWLWRWQEGYAEIKATFQSALDRLAQYEDFIFTSACAAYYKWIEENCPEMFEEIKKRVAENRWRIVGGWWIQPDCNIPSGESFVRQGLYSQRYFRSRFGKKATVGYNVDSFGHNGNLPQILTKSGMNAYVYMRPDGNLEKSYGFKDGVPFRWQGIDGTEILAYRLPEGYAQSMMDDVLPKVRRITDPLREDMGEGPGIMLNYGVGNHGGGPTVKTLENIRKLQKECEDIKLIFSCPDMYFDEVRKAEARGVKLPVLSGDLQHHASGCYSTHAETKACNRRAENRITAAEKCAVLAEAAAGYRYKTCRFENAWEKVLYNQFHDILGGCSIREAYADVREFYGESLTIAAEEYNGALQRISWAIDTYKPVAQPGKTDWKLWEMENLGVPIVVYNPNSWAVETTVQINHGIISGVTDKDGVQVRIQKVRGPQTNGGDIYNHIFRARVPAMGYTVYWAYQKEEKPLPDARQRGIIASPYYLENRRLRMQLDPQTGYIRSLYLKEKGAELIAGAGAVPVVLDEQDLDTWGHNVFTFENDVGRFEDPRFELIENGPVRATIRVTSFYGNSRLSQYFTLYRDGDEIEVGAEVFWTEKHKMLKLAFETTAAAGEAVYEIPYGIIRKKADGCEEPAQNWAAVENGRVGLAIINDGKYSYSVKGGELRLLALRGAGYADHYGYAASDDGFCRFQEQGEHDFTYIIRPYAGSYADNRVVRRGWEMNNPAVFVAETYHKGALPQEMTGAYADSEDIVIGAMKKAEDGDAIILRAYETAGRGGKTALHIPFAKAAIEAEFSPYEIKTYRLENGRAVEANLIEEPIR